MGAPSATLRAQWLGQQLREMRERADLTLKDVGDYINRNASTVSRMEVGMPPARIPEVLAYLDLCGIDDSQHRDMLRSMARDVWQKGWWEGFRGDVASTLIDWMWLENRSNEIWCFEPIVLPGLLQTRNYAKALIEADDVDATPQQVDRFVEARMARQQRLFLDEDSEEEPLALFAIVDEAALRRQVGGPEVMQAQLRHLHEMIDRDNVTVTVLPATTGAHASPNGSFNVFMMDLPYPDVAGMSTAAGNVIVEGDEAKRLTNIYDRLARQAMNPPTSRKFLADLITSLE